MKVGCGISVNWDVLFAMCVYSRVVEMTIKYVCIFFIDNDWNLSILRNVRMLASKCMLKRNYLLSASRTGAG